MKTLVLAATALAALATSASAELKSKDEMIMEFLKCRESGFKHCIVTKELPRPTQEQIKQWREEALKFRDQHYGRR